jgi:spermidine synthase
MVLRIAEDRRYFTYLHEARKRGVEIEVILGDARLTLPSAAPGLDLLVLDAFTSGSIPVHLLTREAFDLYLSKLGPEGVLAFHISNRHLDLAPLMRAMARDLDLAVAVVDGPPDPGGASTSKLGSRWAFLARSKDALRALGLFPEPSSSSGAGIALWTDDRSDLWSLFQW